MKIISFIFTCLSAPFSNVGANKQCRKQPGDIGFPSQHNWNQLNSTVGGRLITVVPSAKFCHDLPPGKCSESEWQSTNFRGTIPGAMDSYNWEQDYFSDPPSLCLQNGTTCGQGNVPVFAINASSPADIQAGVNFAALFNLKLTVKASGHDFLGRSTAKGSLLLWTHYLRNITFTDHFFVGNFDMGSAVTVGSGVPLNLLYAAAKSAGRMVVGGTAANVVAAGGYLQGGGHSAFGPLFGMAVDNALEINIVTANGNFITTNEDEHSDLFWALRGGGAGSWGVIVSATFRTYPTFNATLHQAVVFASTIDAAGQLTAVHARHIFDWDDVRAGGYFFMFPGPIEGLEGNAYASLMYFSNLTADQATAAMKPLMDDIKGLPDVVIVSENTTSALANDLVFAPDDALGGNAIIGSRLIPAEAYRNNVEQIASSYKFLLQQKIGQITAHLAAGGKVSDNANVSSALLPKWRSAKTHVIVASGWDDNATVSEIETIKQTMTTKWVPTLANMTGENDSGAYSNEADVREPDFQATFFGPNYDRLLVIKNKYDPNGLFIVDAGVGSEAWQDDGICMKH